MRSGDFPDQPDDGRRAVVLPPFGQNKTGLPGMFRCGSGRHDCQQVGHLDERGIRESPPPFAFGKAALDALPSGSFKASHRCVHCPDFSADMLKRGRKECARYLLHRHLVMPQFRFLPCRLHPLWVPSCLSDQARVRPRRFSLFRSPRRRPRFRRRLLQLRHPFDPQRPCHTRR